LEVHVQTIQKLISDLSAIAKVVIDGVEGSRVLQRSLDSIKKTVLVRLAKALEDGWEVLLFDSIEDIAVNVELEALMLEDAQVVVSVTQVSVN